MKKLTEMTAEELRAFDSELQKKFEDYKKQGIALNMSRGRPAAEQLNLADDIFSLGVDKTGYKSENGTDCRNYGVLYGIDECRRLFGEILGVDKNNVIACGSSSLNLMFDYFAQLCYSGAAGEKPWMLNKNAKFIALVPGYDRHFAIAEYFGIKLVNVKMTATGPDMEKVKELAKDPDVKGMFCVPKYSNPDGITYSDETVRELASMETAAKDFRIIWDEAYIVHDLYDEGDRLLNVFDEAKKYGNEDRFVAFTSTSKITYAGAGVSVIAASDRNIEEITKRLTCQTISYDKMNQLRHCHFFRTADDVRERMKKHAAILRPKFDALLEIMDREIKGLGIAEWNSPRGGYFVSLDVNVGSAKYVGELCREAGVILTNVGATFPYGNDPDDRNIRLAPSCPTVDEIKTAAEIICLAVKMSACRYLLQGK